MRAQPILLTRQVAVAVAPGSEWHQIDIKQVLIRGPDAVYQLVTGQQVEVEQSSCVVN